MMRISIAMATYNGAAYLQEQLDSFLVQTRLPDELVVCDDASTDGTIELLEAFRRLAPFPVRILKNEKNLGFIQTFVKAISHCAGSVIFLSDQDDVWFPNKIERVLQQFLLSQSCLVVTHDAELTDLALRSQRVTLANRLKARGHPAESIFHGCCMAFRSPLKPLISPIPPHAIGHDAWINALATALSAKEFLPEVLIYYRRHSSNQSSQAFWSAARQGIVRSWFSRVTDRTLRTNPVTACEARLTELRLLIDRIAYHAHPLGMTLANPGIIQNVLVRLNVLYEANETRKGLLKLGILQRASYASHLYRNGFYSNFGGAKSMAKDLLWNIPCRKFTKSETG